MSLRSGVRLAVLGAACALTFLAAPPVRAEPGDELTVYMVTFGPSEHPFFKFGHDAIWIQPKGQPGGGLVFNFGTFSFDQPNLIPKFLRGRLMYWLSVSPVAETFYTYEEANRSIEVQELELTPAQRWSLFERLRDNARPEKREYLYDYFWDNCSTRVRDAIDATIGGRLKAAGQQPATMSMRDNALRMTQGLLWEYVGLHFGLGSPTDAPMNAWQEGFLPDKLQALVRQVRVERDGQLLPLVKSERVLFAAQRPKTPTEPPHWLGWFFAVGALSGGSLFGLGHLARKKRAARIAFGLLTSLLALALGLLGTILLLLWVATNHRAAHANANIFLCPPWTLALVPLGIVVAFARARGRKVAFWIAASAVVSCLLGVLFKLTPGTAQDNWAFLAMLFPFWLGLAVALRGLAASSAAPTAQ